MLPVLDIWVPGLPKTKGSVNAYGPGQVEPSSKGMKTWANLVASRAMRGIGYRPGHPPHVQAPDAAFTLVAYFLPAPGAVGYLDPATGGLSGARVGDLDKLERCVNDALTEARVWDDDVQVVRALPEKHYAGPDIGTGAHIRVFQLTPDEVGACRATAIENARRARMVSYGQGYPTGG